MKRIVIIGGGISGLAAMHRLLELNDAPAEPLEVLLFEASSRLGGIIQTDSYEGFLIERGPDSFISEKPQVIQLARRLGIESSLIPTNRDHRRSFIVRKGRLQSVPEGFQLLAPTKIWPFLRSGVFSVRGKARIAAELVLPRRNHNGDMDEPLAHFVRRRFGDEALTRMAQPMVAGIYTGDPEKLSLRATFPRFLDMEDKYRSVILGLVKTSKSAELGASGPRYSLFLSFEKGMQSLVDALAERIANLASRNADPGESPKTSIHLQSAVESLRLVEETQDRHWRVNIKGGQTISADAVCLATPAHVSARLLAGTASELSRKLAAIPHAATATINLAYRRKDVAHPLDGFGFVVPYLEHRSLLACTFSSVKFRGRAPSSWVLLRGFVGGTLQPEVFALPETEMVSRVCNDLRDLIGAQNSPRFAQVSRWPDAMPQYEIGHLKLIQEIKAEVQQFQTLRIAGNAYDGPGLPDCIRSGETAAEEILDALKGVPCYSN